MHFSCDLTLTINDGEVFEWVLFIRSVNYAVAAEFAQQAVTSRWHGTAKIEELCLSLDKSSEQKQASGDDETPGVYASRPPR